MRRLMFVALAVGGLACSGVADPAAPILELENGVAEPLYFAVFDQEILARIDWAPSGDPENPNRVSLGERVALTADDVVGFTPENTIVLYWWRLSASASATSGFVPMQLSRASLHPRALALRGRHVRVTGFAADRLELARRGD